MVLSLVVLSSLLAALSWGVGDFSGGIATKEHSVFLVIIFSQILGILTLIIIIPFVDEEFSSTFLIWPILAGIFGAMGLIALYQGLSAGRMGIVAPLSALFATGIPVIYSSVTEGTASNLQILGFMIAIVSILLLSIEFNGDQTDLDTPSNHRFSLFYGLLSGIGFGMFFILINQFESNSVFWPLTILRISSIGFLICLTYTFRKNTLNLIHIKPIFHNKKLIIAAGVGDALGNVFFTIATQTGRLDISVIISSLYPLITIFLAWLIYNEVIYFHQKLAVTGALLSVVLLSI